MWILGLRGLNAPDERIATLRGCVNFPCDLDHDYLVERH